MKMKAPGRASSMKEKSSAPMVGGAFGIDMGVARDLARDAGGEVGLRRMIDGRGIAAAIFDPRRRAARFGKTGGDLVDSLFDHVAGRGFERADRAVEPGRIAG